MYEIVLNYLKYDFVLFICQMCCMSYGGTKEKKNRRRR